MPAGITLLFALAGNTAPDGGPAQRSGTPPARFKHALGAHFNLVGVNVAAGKGVEGALETAAAGGQGAGVRRDPPSPLPGQDHRRNPLVWIRPGEDLGVAELRELAATSGLAGDVGAKVRSSLAAKAATLRSRGLAEIEEAANAANERMSLRVVLLVVAFIVFIGYPAVFRIFTNDCDSKTKPYRKDVIPPCSTDSPSKSKSSPTGSKPASTSPATTNGEKASVQWVIIVAIVAALAIAVGAIIVAKVTAKANNINLNNGNGL